jgi:hypothetical protein
VLIVGSTFDDATVPPFAAAASAAASLKQSLITRYAVPPEQVVLISDPSRIRLEQAVPEAMTKAARARQLLVAVAGRVAIDSKSQPLVAPRDFDRSRPELTGVPLASLLAEIDKSSAAEKIVVLDLAPLPAAAQSAAGALPIAAMVDSIRGTRSHPLLKTTPIFASDAPGSGADAASAAPLVAAVATGLAGPADPNRDNRVTVAELHDYLKASASAAGPIRLILPDTTPPRLSDDAKAAIRRLAAATSKQRIDKANAQSLIAAAEQLAPKQPEPKLVGAILLLKSREYNEGLSLL